MISGSITSLTENITAQMRLLLHFFSDFKTSFFSKYFIFSFQLYISKKIHNFVEKNLKEIFQFLRIRLQTSTLSRFEKKFHFQQTSFSDQKFPKSAQDRKWIRLPIAKATYEKYHIFY